MLLSRIESADSNPYASACRTSSSRRAEGHSASRCIAHVPRKSSHLINIPSFICPLLSPEALLLLPRLVPLTLLLLPLAPSSGEEWHSSLELLPYQDDRILAPAL